MQVMLNTVASTADQNPTVLVDGDSSLANTHRRPVPSS
jgi:hypothetical protein